MTSSEEKTARISRAIEELLRALDQSLGKHPELIETPVRTASMWLNDLVDGYDAKPADILLGGSPVAGDSDLVVVRDIFFHSVCPHHLLPFHGRAHVAYIPGGRIVGFSKITRLIDCFAHRLILQEELGRHVVDALMEHLDVKGAACLLDTEQLCMVIRGVRKPGSRVVTTSYAGVMASDEAAKSEFLATINAQE